MADQAETTASTETEDAAAGDTTTNSDTGTETDLAAIAAVVEELGLKPQQIAERLKHSRTWEERAKANTAAAEKLKEIEDANKTEQEKLTEALEEARKDATTSRSELARLRAAVKHGLSEDDLDLLGDGDPDEIEQRAEKLAARIGSAGGDSQQQKPPPVRGFGQAGDGDKPIDVSKVIDAIPPTF